MSTPPPSAPLGLIAALAPLAIVGLLLAAWGIDTATGGDVVRNVELAGRPVGGDELTELDGTIAAYTDQLATTPVRLVTLNGELTTTAAELGVSVDADATRQAVLDAGRSSRRPALQWLASMVSHEVDPVVDVDAATVSATVIALEGEKPGPAHGAHVPARRRRGPRPRRRGPGTGSTRRTSPPPPRRDRGSR